MRWSVLAVALLCGCISTDDVRSDCRDEANKVLDECIEFYETGVLPSLYEQIAELREYIGNACGVLTGADLAHKCDDDEGCYRSALEARLECGVCVTVYHPDRPIGYTTCLPRCPTDED